MSTTTEQTAEAPAIVRLAASMRKTGDHPRAWNPADVAETQERAAALVEALELPAAMHAEFARWIPEGARTFDHGFGHARDGSLKIEADGQFGNPVRLTVADAVELLELIDTQHPTARMAAMCKLRRRGSLSFVPVAWVEAKHPEIPFYLGTGADQGEDHARPIGSVTCQVDRTGNSMTTATVGATFEVCGKLWEVEIKVQDPALRIDGQIVYGKHGPDKIVNRALVNQTGYFHRSVTFAAGSATDFGRVTLYD